MEKKINACPLTAIDGENFLWLWIENYLSLLRYWNIWDILLYSSSESFSAFIPEIT
ncbi:hypothetical protein Mpet_0417 [Methanolacinia petrolearia DSM 11571]|uniref:Uncharacterized protein n=1 Tax=Methanolacinia petrolearia (strain DSM 11571 / OCM 486 / SEBR 4847) TaxID=679926 RepID=E1RGI0_METP4|nr:hypothetical protein [Methanolacinia petrolearia]ADN35191.1 hypothetical protein Mpet_0417 [Methanolacinia petrolearia DSM 11571]